MKFSELKVGMLTNHGLITELIPAGCMHSWGSDEAVMFVDHEDSHYGECGCVFSAMKEWNIIHEKGTPEYSKMISKMIQGRAAAATDAANECTRMLKFL